MKLRNKRTGEIDDYEFITPKEKGTIRITNGKSPVEDTWEFDSFADTWEFDSLTELFEHFEDYKPKEPRIDNKEIREIIRAWANVNDSLVLKYDYDENSLVDIYRNEITFNMGLGLKDGEKYTIAELCGEEEE